MAVADNLKKRKIAVLGSRSVGKSALVIQFIEGRFVDSYFPTIESRFAKNVNYNGAQYECEIIDTAGQDEYSIFNSKHAIGIHGYVLVYSVTSRNSFDMIHVVHDKITNFCGVQEIPCVVVGSKIDLEPARQVDASDGEELAKTLGAAFVETSAKENKHIGQAFELCLQEIQKHTPNSQAEPPASRCTVM